MTISKLLTKLESSLNAPSKAQVSIFAMFKLFCLFDSEFSVKSAFFKKSRGLTILDYICAKVSLQFLQTTHWTKGRTIFQVELL